MNATIKDTGRTQVERDGPMGTCYKCGAQTTTILNYTGVPRHISPSGKLAVPHCDNCLPIGAKATKALLTHEGPVN
jgi:hypothetical protein